MAKRHEDRQPGRRPPRAAPPRRAPGPRRRRGIRVTPAPAARLEGDGGGVRLNRFLAMAGVCSRRAADEYISGGRVEVNGAPATELGRRIDPAHDEVRVDGEPV